MKEKYKYINNGIKCIRININEDIPNGWKRGYLDKRIVKQRKSKQGINLEEALQYLFKDNYNNEMKRYAELTRIVPSTEKCKK